MPSIIEKLRLSADCQEELELAIVHGSISIRFSLLQFGHHDELHFDDWHMLVGLKIVVEGPIG